MFLIVAAFLLVGKIRFRLVTKKAAGEWALCVRNRAASMVRELGISMDMHGPRQPSRAQLLGLPGSRSDRHFKQVFSEIRERFHPIVHHRQNRESKHDSYDRCTRAKVELVDPIAHGTEFRCLVNKAELSHQNRNDES
jgi:hypothetical protein